MPFPMPRIRPFVPLSVRPAVLAPHGSIFLATPRVFTSSVPKKNMAQNEQDLTSEPLSKPSTGPSIQGLCMKIDSQLIAAAFVQERLVCITRNLFGG